MAANCLKRGTKGVANDVIEAVKAAARPFVDTGQHRASRGDWSERYIPSTERHGVLQRSVQGVKGRPGSALKTPIHNVILCLNGQQRASPSIPITYDLRLEMLLYWSAKNVIKRHVAVHHHSVMGRYIG